MTCMMAFLFDTLLGDPFGTYHPVALIGKLIGKLENFLYCKNGSHSLQLFAGSVLSILVLLIVYDMIVLIMHAVSQLPSWAMYVVQGFILSFTICPRSLAKAAMEIYRLLLHRHIHLARTRVGWIVGRDTDKLDESEIVRATVETVAENTTDGILSPLFFYAIGGVPLAFVYRAVNTLDSMIGYKNERYLYFGRFAARLDDIMNYIPARIGGLLFIIAAFLLRYQWRDAWRMMRRDAAKHPSPNGGYAEATVAGALSIRLGGYNSYFGKTTFRAYMGDAIQVLVPNHIRRAVYLMYIVTGMAVLAVACMSW